MAILLLLFVALSVLVLPATPVIAADGPTGGLVVGANFATVDLGGSGATGVDPGVKVGMFAGGFGLFPLTPTFAIQPEVAYSQKHFTLKDPDRRFDATDVWDWIEVPILLRVSFTGNSSGPYVIGGPGFSYLARAKEEEGARSFDIKDNVERFDVNLIGGVGYAAGHFGVEARFDAGMRDLNKNLGRNITVKSRAARINVTWTF
jgi:hypothetical protein